ncbi:hypothetical protein [uncultured Dubosiella sp.]|nr:hypothetical protein [uncultured Dubosiella sp.]
MKTSKPLRGQFFEFIFVCEIKSFSKESIENILRKSKFAGKCENRE